MSEINKKYFMRLSAMDEEDAFDPADLSPEELYSIGRNSSSKFKDKYKSYYDDIKTDNKLFKEDW